MYGGCYHRNISAALMKDQIPLDQKVIDKYLPVQSPRIEKARWKKKFEIRKKIFVENLLNIQREVVKEKIAKQRSLDRFLERKNLKDLPSKLGERDRKNKIAK